MAGVGNEYSAAVIVDCSIGVELSMVDSGVFSALPDADEDEEDEEVDEEEDDDDEEDMLPCEGSGELRKFRLLLMSAFVRMLLLLVVSARLDVMLLVVLLLVEVLVFGL